MEGGMKQKYRMTFKCSEPECRSVFEKITTNINLTNPRCPYCKEAKQATKLVRSNDGAVTEEELALVRAIRNKDFSTDPHYLAKVLGPTSQASQASIRAKDTT